MKSIIVFISIVLLLSNNPLIAKEVNLLDYGVKPWSFENASPAIRKALESVKGEKDVVIKFPGGRIDLWPEDAVKKELFISNTTENDTISKVKNIGLYIEDFSGLTLEGNNTLVVLHGKMLSFAILKSKNITIRDLHFDYDKPTMAELKIVNISDRELRLQSHPDTQFKLINGKVVFYGEGWSIKDFHTVLARPNENLVYRSQCNPFENLKVKCVSKDTITLKGDVSDSGFKEGDVLTIRNPYRDNCGAFINLSKNVHLEKLYFHYMHGMGIISQFSENITFKKVEVVPRQKSGRIISAFADCFHFSGCKGEILVDSCKTSGAHDDPMNVHGTHLKITNIEDRKLTVEFMHNQTYGFDAFFDGDSVAYVDSQNLLIFDIGIVKKANRISKRKMELFMKDGLPKDVKIGDCLENISWTPAVTVRNCHFERTTTRGLLVTTRKRVLIENNTFYRTGMHAILIANDCNYWYESGAVQDVIIRKNRFIQCAYTQGQDGYVVAIRPETHVFEKNKFIHANIRIERNSFECMGKPVLFARSVNKLSFLENTMSFKPIIEKNKSVEACFYLEHCKNIKVEHNDFEGFEGVRLTYAKMEKPKVQQVSFKVLENK